MNIETSSLPAAVDSPKKKLAIGAIGAAVLLACAGGAYLYIPASFAKSAATLGVAAVKTDESANTIVAFVNGSKITEAELVAGGMTNASSRAQMVDDYVNKSLMASDMESDVPPEVAGRLLRARRDILAESWIRNHAEAIKAGLVEQDYQDVYKAEVRDELFAKYRLSFIMTASADEDIKDKAWTSLKTAANEEWLGVAAVPYQMGALVATMKKGDVTQSAIAVREGFIRLRVDDIQAGKKPTFAEAKPKIADILVGRKLQASLQALRGKADIRIK